MDFIAANIFQWIRVPGWADVLFFSILVVLVYLYFTSELINKRHLTAMVLVAVVIFLGANIFLNFQQKSPPIERRIAIFPLSINKDGGDNNSALRLAFWDVVNQQIDRRISPKIAVVKSVDLLEIVNGDSVGDPHYCQRIAKLIGADDVLIGDADFSQKGNLHCLLMRVGKLDTLFEINTAVAPETIAAEANKITAAVFDKMGIREKSAANISVKEINPQSYFYFLQAQKLFSDKNYPGTMEMAGKAVAADSNFAEAVLLLGKAHFFSGLKQKENGKLPVESFAAAFDCFSRAIALDSTLAESYAFLGEYYIHKKRWSLAEWNLKKALELNPRVARIYLNLSRLHPSRFHKLGFRDETELYRRAIEVNPCNQDGYLMLADYYLFQNQKDDAIRTLESYLKINPNSVPVLMALGKNYMLKRDVLKIIEVYNRVIALEPDNADAFYNLGVWYYNSDDFENAEKFFQRAVAINNHLNSHLYLAYLYEMKGEMDKAIEQLRYRIHYRKGFDDEFAEDARKHLYELLHPDTEDKK